MANFPAVLDVSTLDGSNGFVLYGEDYDSQLQDGSVVGAGDINGDGFDDVIVGVPFAGPMYDGEADIVYGTGAPRPAKSLLFEAHVGYVVGQGGEYEYVGQEVGALGDINGDGFADFVVSGVGGAGLLYDAPASYVVFGNAGGVLGDLANLNGNNGFKTNSASAGYFRIAGDINGDGFGDLFLGNGVFFGKPSGTSEYESFNLATLDGSTGFTLVGGLGFTAAGDVNGDGFDDIIAGNPLADTKGADAGEAYVVFGKAGGFAASLDPSAVDGVDGFTIFGSGPGQKAGSAVSRAGDVNGDGFDDVVVSTQSPGLFHVVFGRAAGFADGIDLAALDPTSGFTISGASGLPIAAGDINGDTLGDLIVGTSVLFGRAGVSVTDIDAATLDGSTGFGVSGNGVSGLGAAGDVNGDGFDDLVTIVPEARDADPSVHGKIYFVFGHADGPRTWVGSAADEHFVGSAGDDVLDGAGGKDRLQGVGGSDILIGGPGGDLLDGGAGRDAVSFAAASGGVTVDLGGATATGPGQGHDTLLSIENAIGSSGDDVLAGDRRANRLDGGAGADLLRGGDGNDTLIGGSGIDRLEGGAGDDTYVIDEAGDLLSEAKLGGIDQVRSSIRFSLGGTQVENLTLMGGALNGTGNSLDNRITGNAGDNVLRGAGGQDALFGVAGNDQLFGDDDDDTLDGGVGDDQLLGGEGDDSLDGGAGNDRLEGGAGNDTATYASAALGVSVSLAIAVAQDTLAAGWDTLVGIENLQGSNQADALAGEAGANFLDGGKGNDILRGGAGDDTLVGGDGNDTLEGEAGDEVELGGAGNDVFGFSSGFTAGDALDGGSGRDTLLLNLDLAAGVTFAARTMAGIEVIDLAAGHSYGLVLDDANVAAGALLTVYGNDLGRGDVLGFDGSAETDGRFDIRGGSSGDALHGGAGNDKVVGGSGNDRLDGGAGIDKLYGGSGADVLSGGLGADLLFGDAGADLFAYIDVAESTLAAADTIENWEGGDRIDLSAIDADSNQAGNQAFVYIGAAAFSAAGQLQVTTTALETFVRGDIDGDGTADFAIRLAGVQVLGESSFVR